MTDVIYHYTGEKGGLAMIESSTLWASDVNCMNDKDECGILLNAIQKVFGEQVCWERKAAVAVTAGVLYHLLFKANILVTPYIACFSKKRDSLTQWVHYADEAKGIALGFDRSKFVNPHTKNRVAEYPQPTPLLKDAWALYDLSYDVDDLVYNRLREYLEGSYLEMLPFIERLPLPLVGVVKESLSVIEANSTYLFETGKNISKLLNIKLAMDQNSPMYHMLCMSHYHKHEGFVDEREVRLAFSPMGRKDNVGRMYGSEGLCGLMPQVNDLQKWRENMRGESVHYFEYNFEKELLCEVILGPKFQGDFDEYREFLNENGMEHVNLEKSQLPYR